MRTLFGGETAETGAPASGSGAPANQAAAALVIPDDLRPLVQQQLDAAATQRLAWHGDIWPQQSMDWEVERDARQDDGVVAPDAVWNTRLRLVLPRLGAIDARLQLSGQTVQLVLQTSSAASEAALNAAVPSLQQALATSGLTLQGVQANHDTV
jgi:flagellar hook-length control protein FliK